MFCFSFNIRLEKVPDNWTCVECMPSEGTEPSMQYKVERTTKLTLEARTEHGLFFVSSICIGWFLYINPLLYFVAQLYSIPSFQRIIEFESILLDVKKTMFSSGSIYL